MKVEILDDGLLIVPETDFEEAFLTDKFGCHKHLSGKHVAFLKTGLTPADLEGLKILFKEE